jgi:hypothetical protein
MAIALAGVGAATQQPARWAPAVGSLANPSAANSVGPQLTVSRKGVLLSWIEQADGRATLKFAERTIRGWSPARTVASGNGWFVNWADVPSVIRLADGTLAAHWLQKSGGDSYAYDVRLSYSRDDGRTWVPSFTPHTDGTKTEHGFASLFQMPGTGGLGLVWLDGRNMKPGTGEHGGGDMSLRFAAYDRTWKQVQDAAVDLEVCECCPTSVAASSEGPIAVYRNRAESEIRDIHVTRFAGGTWSEPAPVAKEDWQFPACPVRSGQHRHAGEQSIKRVSAHGPCR